VTFQQYTQLLLEFVTSYPLVTNVSLTFREIAEDEGHVADRVVEPSPPMDIPSVLSALTALLT
jgi:hypothetical protein